MRLPQRFTNAWLPALLALALLAAAFYATLAVNADDSHAAALYETGALAAGEVVSITMSAGRVDKYGRPHYADYFLTYRFMDAAGVSHEAMSHGRGAPYSELEAGDTLPVRYLPENPTVSVFDIGVRRNNVRSWWIILMLAGGAALAGYVAFQGFRCAPVSGRV